MNEPIPGLRWYCAPCGTSVLVENRANHELGASHERHVRRDTPAPVAQPLPGPMPDERVECSVCRHWPMARNWANHMTAYSGHWPIWDAARSVPDPEAHIRSITGPFYVPTGSVPDNAAPDGPPLPAETVAHDKAFMEGYLAAKRDYSPGGMYAAVPDNAALREAVYRFLANWQRGHDPHVAALQQAYDAAPASPAGLDVEQQRDRREAERAAYLFMNMRRHECGLPWPEGYEHPDCPARLQSDASGPEVV